MTWYWRNWWRRWYCGGSSEDSMRMRNSKRKGSTTRPCLCSDLKYSATTEVAYSLVVGAGFAARRERTCSRSSCCVTTDLRSLPSSRGTSSPGISLATPPRDPPKSPPVGASGAESAERAAAAVPAAMAVLEGSVAGEDSPESRNHHRPAFFVDADSSTTRLEAAREALRMLKSFDTVERLSCSRTHPRTTRRMREPQLERLRRNSTRAALSAQLSLR
mmetsp:Transcript_7312/g.16202  ORF Transcript_7312/g.16202 Transcript_7312/m.16202 type:complete len:218 (-) Transcript_7312:115-768(-)